MFRSSLDKGRKNRPASVLVAMCPCFAYLCYVLYCQIGFPPSISMEVKALTKSPAPNCFSRLCPAFPSDRGLFVNSKSSRSVEKQNTISLQFSIAPYSHSIALL